MSERKEGWWNDFYEDTPFEIFMERENPQELAATLDYLARVLEVAPGDTIFDQCCGFGSMSVPLAEGGYKMIGVDLCEKYVRMARERTAAAKLGAEFHCADAFQFTPQAKCDAAFNWYTSFGYSDDDKVNIKMLERAFAALKPGKKFALEYPNIAHLLRGFKSQIRYSKETPSGLVSVQRDCSIVPERGVMLQRWEHTLPDERKIVNDTSLKLYLPHTLVEMFKKAGFTKIDLHGSIKGEPLALESERCIVSATKP
jgi:SAM-dependent methyltransferase